MNRLRIAVVGAGHLGRIHARLLASVENAELVGVVDPDQQARNEVAANCQTRGFVSHRDLIGRIDAAIVAAPTRLHHAVAMELLEEGIHVLVEKPIAASAAEADELVERAHRNQLVLQVGHVERFNPALQAAVANIGRPKYIEAVRTSGFTFRSTDVGVVLDLMIHDLDVAMSLVATSQDDCRVVEVQALGLTLFGPHEDMAQARLVFQNGCVANLTASRASFHSQRTMQVFSTEGYTSIDFAQRCAQTIRPSPALLAGDCSVERLSPQKKDHILKNLFTEMLPRKDVLVDDQNALLEEQRDFIQSVRTACPPRVTGRQGRDVLAVAETILEKIAVHRWNGDAFGPVGPNFASREPILSIAGERHSVDQSRKAG